jgi:hypothetical protein
MNIGGVRNGWPLVSTSAGFLTQHKRWTEQPAWFTERDAVGVAFEHAVLS